MNVNKYINILTKYSIFNTLLAYFKISHPRAASVVVANKGLILMGKGATIDIENGRLLIGETDSPTNKRFESTELILDDGAGITCAGDLILYEGVKVRVGKNAKCSFGHHTYLNRSTSIDCTLEVTIGDNCAISDNVQILDSDFHTIAYKSKTVEKSKPIHIGNHVWIGRSSIILKGVSIGDGAIIGAGSMVTRSIPPGCLAVGNPARVIKDNIDWK